MKKLLFLLLLSTSFSTFAYELDFSLGDFCYQQPNVQDRSGISASYASNRFHVKHDGVYYFPNEEEGITATSLCFFKDEYGQYDSKGDLKKGLKVGKWTHWYSNGQKWVEAYWKDGKKDGDWLVWYRTGQKRYEENWKNDESDGKWIWWHQNGQIELEGNYKNGKPIDKWTWWDANGSIEKIETFNSEGLSISCEDAYGERLSKDLFNREGLNITEASGISISDCNIYEGRNNFNGY